MAINVVLAGNDDNFNALLPFYKREADAGRMNIVAILKYEEGEWKIEQCGENITANYFILSTRNHFYEQYMSLQKMGVNRDMIVDGAIFKVWGFNFSEYVNTKKIHGVVPGFEFVDETYSYANRVYDGHDGKVHIEIGKKSYVAYAKLEWYMNIYIGNFCSISWDQVFLAHNTKGDHDYKSVTHYGKSHMDWRSNTDDSQNSDAKQIEFKIGNDVWIGRGCRLKSTEKTLTIGDGAVIASDTAVVSSVPPYAIWGGNPGRLIKYRFPKEIIDELLKIKWWNWDIEKIHDNWKDFEDPVKFVEKHGLR